MPAGNKRKRRADELSFRLMTLSFSLIAILLFSVVSIVSMNAQGQNSTSTSNSTSTGSDPSEQSETPSASNSTSGDANAAGSNSTSSEENTDSNSSGSSGNSTSSDPSSNQTSTTSTAEGQEQSQNTTSSQPSGNLTSSSSEDNQNANGTSTVPTEQNATSTQPVAANQTASNATSTQIEAPVSEATQNATVSFVTEIKISGEPLLPTLEPITRSFSFPVLKLNADVVSEIQVTIIWNPDGSVKVSDNRGYSYLLKIPASQNTTLTLLHNSTVVDQRVIGVDFQYDVYWLLRKDGEGMPKYEFIIAGSSTNMSLISLEVERGDDFKANSNHMILTRSNIESLELPGQDLDPALKMDIVANTEVEPESDAPLEDEFLDGLVLDWSDAVAQGYDVFFDEEKSSLIIQVNGSFVIDPSVVGSVSNNISSPGTSAFSGQRRLVTTTDGSATRLYAFYYDGSNIVYRTSDDDGETWSSNPISLATGSLGESFGRWSLITTTSYNDTGSEADSHFVHVFYWNLDQSSNMHFYTKRGTVDGLTISWGSAVEVGYVSGASCVCPFVSAASDSDGIIYAAFAWESTDDYIIKKSEDGGATWTTSLSTVNEGSNMAINLTPLESGKMLFVFAKYGNNNLYYRLFDGSGWGTKQTLSGTGLSSSTSKQLSSAVSADGSAYVAYTNVTGSSAGILKVVKFFNNGTFATIETADSTLRHRLPNIISNPSGDLDINSIASSKIYNTRKSSNGWEAPFNPYGTSFTAVNQLTARTVLSGENGALWTEGSSTPYTIKFDLLEDGMVNPSSTIQNSPSYADYFEGERRVASNVNGTMFAFYYDGSNIVYKTSFDNGRIWTGTATSTGTGSLAPDNFRWTIAHTLYNGTDRIALLYYVISGSNTNFYAKTFKAFDSGLVLVGTSNLFSAANEATCNPTGTCAAAAGASDTNSNLFAGYRWKSGGMWHYKVMKSSNGGSSWTTSLSTHDFINANAQVPITLTSLESGKMLLAWTRYDTSDIFYKIFNGTSWSSNALTITGTGSTPNTVKQISSGSINRNYATDSTSAYVAFLTGGNQGTLKVAVFSGDGTFRGIETVDSSIVHWLPSISVTSDGVVHIYTLYNNVIYDTRKTEIPVTNGDFESVKYGPVDSPKAYWSFDNDTLDYAGNSNDGTTYGNTTFTDGTNGMAASFDGAGDYVRVADAASLDISGSITLSTWVQLAQQTSDLRSVMNKEGAYLLEKDSSNRARFAIWSGGSSTPAVTGTTSMQAGKWYHVAGTYDGTNLRVYVNGVLEGTQSRSGSISLNSNDLYIASGNATSRFLNATLDDVHVFNRNLSAREVQSLGTEWDQRGAALNVVSPIEQEMDLTRPGTGDTRSFSLSAVSGKLYTLDADVVVTSGNARIDLVFVNSTGFWLTNNTSPNSGVASTTVVGSTKHLSASWIAPSGSSTMIIRLINDASGGSSRFDNIHLSSWDSPVAPYGYDFDSPDQMTAQIPSPYTSGVLWREYGTSPYELVYGGTSAAGVTPVQQSPAKNDYFEGEKRIVKAGSYFFRFYMDSVLEYQYSTTNGLKWSGSKAAPVSGFASDSYRWTVTNAKINGYDYVFVFFTKATTGSNVELRVRVGQVAGFQIGWATGDLVLATLTKHTACGTGVCASVVAAPDSSANPNVFAAFSYLKGGAITYAYQIFKITRNSDGTFSKSISLTETPNVSTNRIAMALTKLESSKMLFVYAEYSGSSEFTYRKFSGSSWGSELTTSGAGMSSSKVKQISAATNSNNEAYVAYIKSGPNTDLWLGKWTKTGDPFSSSPFVSVVPSGISGMSLPSISFYSGDGSFNIFTLTPGISGSTSKIFHTLMPKGGAGSNSANLAPFVKSFVVADQLAGSTGYPAAIWTDKSSTSSIEYIVTSGVFHFRLPPYSNAEGWPISPNPGCAASLVWCDWWDLNSGRIWLYDSPQNPGDNLQSYVKFNTNPLTGNSPTFWRSTTGKVEWGFKHTANGFFTVLDYRFEGEAEVGIEFFRCPVDSAGVCTSNYVPTTTFYKRWTSGAVSSSVYEKAEYQTSLTQSANYKYVATPYGNAIAHRDDCGGSCDAAGATNFGNKNNPNNTKNIRIEYVFRRTG